MTGSGKWMIIDTRKMSDLCIFCLSESKKCNVKYSDINEYETNGIQMSLLRKIPIFLQENEHFILKTTSKIFII